jgi:hypothetical protein
MRPSADSLITFENENLEPVRGKQSSRMQTCETRADDDDVVFFRGLGSQQSRCRTERSSHSECYRSTSRNRHEAPVF